MKTKDPSKTSFALLRELSPRAREVIERRFGLRTETPETLEAIGQDFGITRERVRQIEEDGLRKIKERTEDRKLMGPVPGLYRDWLRYLKAHGDIQKEEIFLAAIAEPKRKQHAAFLLTLADVFERTRENEDFYAAWACDKKAPTRAQECINAFVKALNGAGRSMDEKELWGFYRTELQQKLPNVTPRILFSYLALSKRIGRGPHGPWGLREWSEISPRGLRDRAYLVYKKESKPLHFTDVAKLIDFHGFNTKGKKVLAQSVHNDLIRDSRFVLVGRGMYALREWGYEPGIVRDVIARVLQDAKKPLSPKEVISLVVKQRQVKEGTILLNLQDREYFIKTSDGKYTLAKTQETTLA